VARGGGPPALISFNWLQATSYIITPISKD